MNMNMNIHNGNGNGNVNKNKCKKIIIDRLNNHYNPINIDNHKYTN